MLQVLGHLMARLEKLEQPKIRCPLLDTTSSRNADLWFLHFTRQATKLQLSLTDKAAQLMQHVPAAIHSRLEHIQHFNEMHLIILHYFFPLTDFVGEYLEEIYAWQRMEPIAMVARAEEQLELLSAASARLQTPLPECWLRSQCIRSLKRLLFHHEIPLVTGEAWELILCPSAAVACGLPF